MLVNVSPALGKRCLSYGDDVVEAYKAGKSERSKSLRVVGKPSIWDKPVEQAWGKLYEVAVCLAIGIPIDNLLWDAGKADPGYDIAVKNVLVDVKGSSLNYAQCLIWPASKRHFLDNILATHFIFVRRECGDIGQHVLVNIGWGINVGVFRNEHWVSDPNSGRQIEQNMAPGTAYMKLENLESADLLLEWMRRNT